MGLIREGVFSAHGEEQPADSRIPQNFGERNSQY